MEERIGLIDIGSNTIRLVIFGFTKETGLNEILNIKTPARLSQYLTSDTEMNDDGIAVLKEALLSFKKLPTNLRFKSFILLRQLRFVNLKQ